MKCYDRPLTERQKKYYFDLGQDISEIAIRLGCRIQDIEILLKAFSTRMTTSGENAIVIFQDILNTYKEMAEHVHHEILVLQEEVALTMSVPVSGDGQTHTIAIFAGGDVDTAFGAYGNIEGKTGVEISQSGIDQTQSTKFESVVAQIAVGVITQDHLRYVVGVIDEVVALTLHAREVVEKYIKVTKSNTVAIEIANADLFAGRYRLLGEMDNYPLSYFDDESLEFADFMMA